VLTGKLTVAEAATRGLKLTGDETVLARILPTGPAYVAEPDPS
jgi:hypothetical protein